MLKNYFLVAWRSIIRRPFYTTLNLAGIGIAILFILLIGAFSYSEWRVNHSLRNFASVYYLTSEWKQPDEGISITTYGPLARRLREEYPGLVANYCRGDYITTNVSKGDKHFREHVNICDSSLLTMFGFRLLHGRAATAFCNPFSVVIRKEIALKYFGRTDVVGERLAIQNFSAKDREFMISGVLDDLPENSVTDLNFENHHALFIPANTYAFFPRPDREDWSVGTIPAFVELKAGVTPKALEQPIRQLLKKYASADVQRDLTVRPISLKDYHLMKDNRLIWRTLYAVGFVGLFILLMAVVNFVNISISSSIDRIKEVGIRKVLGGLRREILFQFLVESTILVFLAACIAVLLYPSARPLFSSLVGKELPRLTQFSPYMFAAIIVFAVLLGLAAGAYPAVILSSLNSADSVKGRLRTVSGHIGLRKVLAGVQFCLAGIVIVAAVVVTRQIAYFFGKDLGYDKEYVVTAQVPRDWSPEGVKKMEAVRDQFSRLPGVAAVSLAYEIPDGMSLGSGPIYRAEQDSTKGVVTLMVGSDQNYMDVYKIPMRAGTFLTSADAMNPQKAVLNESGIRALGWKTPEEALGRKIKFQGDPTVCTIVGVTADFHFSSMQSRITPMAYGHVRLFSMYRYLSFRLKPGNVKDALGVIGKEWGILLPGSSFEYRFMDQTLRHLYASELQLQKATYVATFVALLIVLLGVTAFVSMSIRKRTKEIGIRKVLGASVRNITALFLKDFIGVLVLSGLVACPLAGLIMHRWLNGYAYRIPLTAGPFILSLLALAGLTILLIVLQTAKAGSANPVDSLKTD